MARDSSRQIQGFELAGEDQIFHAAQASISGRSILINADAVPNPVAVRYAWADDPAAANLMTAEGFPVAPFRSDNWKCKTEGVRFE